MKNQKIDIDTIFSQFREESKPTPIQNLIEARPSGALFALKTSLSTSFSSVKMWIGMSCLCALVTTGILYTTNTTKQQEHSVATGHTGATDMPVEAFPHQAAPEPAEHSMFSAGIQSADVATVFSRPAGRRKSAAIEKITTGIYANKNGHTAGQNNNRRVNDQNVQTAVPENSGITTVRYRDAVNSGTKEFASAEAASFVPMEEKFPLSDWSTPRNVSLMIDGLPLLADIVQAQSEIQIGDDLSCGFLLGVGNVEGRSADTSHFLFLAGAQFNYYLLGDFEEGLQIGAQALYSSTDIRANKTFLYENGRVLSLTPYAGYKLVLMSGLTMNVQAGIGASTPVFIPTGTGSDQNTVYKWHVSTRMHLNIGWSL